MVDPGVIKTVSVAILLILIFVVLPIVVLLLEHQRKMVRLMRGETPNEDEQALAVILGASKSGSDQALEARVAALEQEVASLRAGLGKSITTGEDSVRELLA